MLKAIPILFWAISSQGQTSSLGITAAMPLFMPAQIKVHTGKESLNSSFYPSLETAIFYEKYFNDEWGMYSALQLGSVPMEYNIKDALGGEVYKQQYLSGTFQVCKKEILSDFSNSYWRAGIDLCYLPYHTENETIESYNPAFGVPFAIYYQNITYNSNKAFPMFGLKIAHGHDWRIFKKHAIGIEVGALLTMQNMLTYDYRLYLKGTFSTGTYVRQFNYANISLSYKYILSSKP